VPLMVARGFSSETFCFEAIEARVGDPRAYDVWYLGDFDRSGRDAAKSLEEKLLRFGAERSVDVDFRQLAIEEVDVICAAWSAKSSAVTCRPNNSKFCASPRRASADHSAISSAGSLGIVNEVIPPPRPA